MILSPLDLCARVCALILAPGLHMVRYYGVLSSHSSLRQAVVLDPPPAVPNPPLDDAPLVLGFNAGPAPLRSGQRRPWA